jgi:DNA invertase Pin-like site-specific DNA recombinase
MDTTETTFKSSPPAVFQNMKVAIYCRISTHKQELENQLIQLRAYCNKSNYLIVKEYVDIMTGKNNSRPQYDAMFADAHKKMFDIILFWDLSRFSRAGTLFTLQKLKELENLNIEWESYQEPYFKSIGQFKDVVLAVIATVAKMEREKIGERTKAAFYVDKDGITRSIKNDKPIGKRGKDKKPRNRIGYFQKKGGIES